MNRAYVEGRRAERRDCHGSEGFSPEASDDPRPNRPPNLEKPRQELRFTPEDVGRLHMGGLDILHSVFGDDSDFFAGREWYVDSFRGGANSAQTFEAPLTHEEWRY